jgi:uncharacterized protein (DUF362 family)
MDFGLHPLLRKPDAVLVYHTHVPALPQAADYRRVASEVLAAMQVELCGLKAALKPNLTSGEHFANPDNGITTHPAFIGGMVDYLSAHGAKPQGIYIVEDPRDSDDFNPRHWKGTGYLEMARATGAKLRSPDSRYCVHKTVPKPYIHPQRNVSRYAVDPRTVLFNVPKLKTHNLGITSLCMKNLMGLDDVFERHYCGQAWKDCPEFAQYDGRPKHEWMDARMHELWQTGLAKRLADLAQVIQPQLNLVEGVVGRDGTGFHRGRNFPLGLVVAGTNVVAVDTVASYLMGFDPARLVYLNVASAVGLGDNNLANLRIYEVVDGSVLPCRSLEALRAPEPFQVIRDIIGEEQV